MKKLTRPVVEVESASQLTFSIEIETRPKQTAPAADSSEVVFKDPDPKKIYLGSQRIDTHLQNAGIKAPGVIRDILDELDWSGFIKLYKPKGRRPYHPRLMMGIILYGVTKGVTSLRGLEQLAPMRNFLSQTFGFEAEYKAFQRKECCANSPWILWRIVMHSDRWFRFVHCFIGTNLAFFCLIEVS